MQRRPAGAELHAHVVDVAVVGRHLAAVMGKDAIAGELERGERLGIYGSARVCDLLRRDADADFAQIDAIVARGELDQSGVLIGADFGQDRGNGVVDVARNFALRRQQFREAGLEIRGPSFKP